jgi:hypothetical protein
MFFLPLDEQLNLTWTLLKCFLYIGSFFSFKSELECVPNFFYLILNLILSEPLALFQRPTPIKS